MRLFGRVRKFFRCSVLAETSRRRVIGAKGNQITFVTDQPDELSASIILRVKIRHSRFNVPVDHLLSAVVTQCEETVEGKIWQCKAEICDASEAVAALVERSFDLDDSDASEENLSQTADPQRGAPRFARAFQVLSPDRKFKGMSVDLSQSGVRVLVEQPLEVGSSLRVTMDFDVASSEPVEVDAEVVWCKFDEEKNAFQVGMRFLDPAPAKAGLIERYLHWLDQAQRNLRRGHLQAPSYSVA
jgi:hypothetical protein